MSDRSLQRQYLSGHLGCAGPPDLGRRHGGLQAEPRAPAASATSAAAAAASASAATSGDADLRGRNGDPGDRDLPGTAASAAAPCAGSGARSLRTAALVKEGRWAFGPAAFFFELRTPFPTVLIR